MTLSVLFTAINHDCFEIVETLVLPQAITNPLYLTVNI